MLHLHWIAHLIQYNSLFSIPWQTLIKMVLKRHEKILTNGQASKVHKHLIKWLSKIIKKKAECHLCQAPRRRCLEVYCDVRERWLLVRNQNKHIIYYIFHILIPKSVLVFHTSAPTSFDDYDFIHCVTLVRDMRTSFWRNAIMIIVLRISSDSDSRSFPFLPSILSCCLVLHGRSCRYRKKSLPYVQN